MSDGGRFTRVEGVRVPWVRLSSQTSHILLMNVLVGALLLFPGRRDIRMVIHEEPVSRPGRTGGAFLNSRPGADTDSEGESERVRADDEEGDSDGLSCGFESLARVEVVDDGSMALVLGVELVELDG